MTGNLQKKEVIVMSKAAVVFWSGTGNTQAMADFVAAGITEAGAEAVIMTSAEFTADMMDEYDAVALSKCVWYPLLPQQNDRLFLG